MKAMTAILPLILLISTATATPPSNPPQIGFGPRSGTGWDTVRTNSIPLDTGSYRNLWGFDILISNDGFGLGTFYRREFSPDWFGFVSFSISESKDDREFERIDPYFGVSFTPGKLNRFLVLPLLFGVQRRLFREDITETFRPYINGGVGPAMIYKMPYVDLVDDGNGGKQYQDVEFFKSLGRGRPTYTLGSFIGVGALFGSERSNVFGVNFRYYFTYLFGEGLPSLYNTSTGAVAGTKKSFGGFMITLNIGTAY